MPRTRKPRFIGGVQLAENLYTDSRGREGYWRYLRPDGTYKGFQATSVEEANKLADEANLRRDEAMRLPEKKLRREELSYWVQKYCDYEERQHPSLKEKESWHNRKLAMNKFARENTNPLELSSRMIEDWWDSLTHNQQALRQKTFRRLFNQLMKWGVVPQFQYNPFTLSDDRPRLYLKEQSRSDRSRLDIDGFWPIYNEGTIALKVAMAISITTTMRRGDVLALTTGHLKDGYLRRTISKSEQKLGSQRAARLEWKLADHPMLERAIEMGLEHAKENDNCPYIVSHKPEQARLGKVKTHKSQVLGRRLAEMFTEARNSTEMWSNDLNPPTFHEVRSLGSALYKRQGYSDEQIKELMAHTEIDMSRHYMDGHDLPHTSIGLRLDSKAIKGAF